MSKHCSKCKLIKEFSEFNKDKYTKTGYTALCRDCTKIKSKKDKDLLKSSKLRLLYNISLEDYNILLEKQDNKCAICERNVLEYGKNLSIDHCHKTGRIRGLLCNKCNQGLGLFNDSPLFLMNAIHYLKQ